MSKRLTGRLRRIGIGVAALVAACVDDQPGLFEARVRDGTRAAATAVVSNPDRGATPGPVAQSLSARLVTETETDGVYVSLQPGTAPKGGLATIENERTGSSVPVAMQDGGFDPVRIDALVGDTVAVAVALAGGGTVSFMLRVPATRRPAVVRTDPPAGRRDVALNGRIVVVFSEPLSAGIERGVRLLRAGAPVSGQATLTPDGLRAEFHPNGLLAANADYVISVSTAVTDLSGDALDAAVRTTFTTGSTVAASWIVTEQTALLETPLSHAPRTFSMYAIKDDNGHVSGAFQIFYSDPGLLIAGRVTCFTTVDSGAWIAGVQETGLAAQDSGLELGWRAVDNGSGAGGVPDQLSLAFPLASSGLGTAQEFCAGTPTIAPSDGSEITLYSLLSGDLLIASGAGGPPPPPPPPPPPTEGISQIAYTYSGGGIQVVAADGSFARQLTSAAGDLYPAWSPNGTKIAFQSDRLRPGSGFGNIYAMKYDGSGVTRLTSDALSELEPAWSPDGKHIAFDRGPDVFIMNADGSGATRVTFGGHPSWSPDGSRLVLADPSSGDLSIINTDGSGLTALTSGAGFYDEMPAWSPDGRMIAFHRRPTNANIGAVYLVNTDGTGVTQLTLKGQRPQWSPDSRRIVFEFNGIYIVNVDGSGLTRVGTGFTPTWSMVGTMPPAPRADRSIAIAGGEGQSDTVYAALAQPLSVRILEANGAPAVGVVISWILDPQGNGAALSVDRSTTDSAGIASVALTLGGEPGIQQVLALVSDGSARSPGVAFTASATLGGH